MTGSRWRLLAACLLICSNSALLRGQRADETGVFAPPVLRGRYSAPVLFEHEPMTPGPPARRPTGGGAPVFQQMVRAAGIIFSGRVTAVAAARFSPNPASTAVTFQVDWALRGTSAGQALTIHEWGGLWANGERYHVGQRVLLFLYPPSKLGLTSPVSGSMGRFAVDPHSRVMMSPLHIEGLAAEPILGRKTSVSYAEIETAVRRSSGEE